MSSFLAVTKTGKGRQGALNRVLQKSVDFLVCNKDFSVFAVIELQDRTHQRESRKKSDEFKSKALSVARVRLVEFHARNLPSVEEIREVLGRVGDDGRYLASGASIIATE